jgi:hypothetical protein
MASPHSFFEALIGCASEIIPGLSDRSHYFLTDAKIGFRPCICGFVP